MAERHDALDRRHFLTAAGLAAGVSALAPNLPATFARLQQAEDESEAEAPPGIDLHTLLEGQKLLAIEFTQSEREQMLESVRQQAQFWEQIRGYGLQNDEGPACVFDPRLPGVEYGDGEPRFAHRDAAPGSLPSSEEDIAYAPVSHLAHWVRTRQISSVDLTNLSLTRLRRLNAQLECVVTFTEQRALEQARKADEEIAAGQYRGPLHGLPWGAKDLLDTKGIPTTWGAEPYKGRIPDQDAAVVERLDAAGAVLIAKLSMGALAYGDIWFGGRTNNPWDLEQGSSGSSAGSASATAAGCVAFSIGTETYGSIGSPSARCGATGFRPSFGRVSRHGAMALCWSLDKIGPICRTAECCSSVLEAIAGADARDAWSIDMPLAIDMTRSVQGARIGYVEADYESPRVSDEDKLVLDTLRALGCELVPIEIPDHPYGQFIFTTILIEATAAFDELTLQNLDDQMKWQEDRAWPNSFRAARFMPATEFFQSQRVRRRFMKIAHGLFENVDAVVAPQAHGAMHALTNMTGQPAITMRTGFRDDGTPRAVTLWGGFSRDGTLLNIGSALERELDLWSKRPALS